MAEHTLKVAPEYWAALADGSKTFEVRRNDRGFQRGDIVKIRQWHDSSRRADESCCRFGISGHWGPDITLTFTVSFVYAGDPRFSGIEPGHVVLGLATASPVSQQGEGKE